MQNEVFISNSINKAIKDYIDNKDREYSLEFNSFFCSVFRMLTIIYGKDELLDSYEENDSEKFDNCLMRYDLEVDELDNFKINFEKYYLNFQKQEKRIIKKKNKFFNLVQKSLIDMMVKRKEKETVEKYELDAFYDLLFTANSKDFYRGSIAVLEAYNPYEIDNYAKLKLGVG